jgi:hypothetical protein
VPGLTGVTLIVPFGHACIETFSTRWLYAFGGVISTLEELGQGVV